MRDNEARTGSSLWVRLGLHATVFTLLGLFDAADSYLRYAYEGEAIPLTRAIPLGLCLWYAWAVLYVFILKLVRRYPLEQGAVRRRLALHLGAGVFFALVKIGMDYPIIKYLYCPHPEILTFPMFFRMGFVSHFYRYVLTYWAMLGVTYTLTFYAKYRDRERRAAVLDVKLAQTQMQVLKAQLHPHFLFNTLHAVSAMIHADPDVADRMIARLGDFLRLTLRHGNAARVTLREELECIEAYLEVEQVRLGARLRVRVEVDPAVLETPVPNFLLQPLVENAVHHGIAPHPSAGRLDLRAYRGGDVLRLEVEDDGPGLANGHPTKQGIGLSNTRARLRRMYGPGHRFDLERGSLGGLRVVLEVPLAEELADSGWPAG